MGGQVSVQQAERQRGQVRGQINTWTGWWLWLACRQTSACNFGQVVRKWEWEFLDPAKNDVAQRFLSPL